MEIMTRARSPLLAFLFMAYMLSIVLSLLIGLTGGYRSRWIGLGYVAMLIPTISLLLTNAVLRHKRRSMGWNRFPLPYLPLALFLMPFVLHAAMLPAASALDVLRWQDWLTPRADGLYHTPAGLGWGVLTTAGLAGRIALNAIAGIVVVSLLALFEEVGWRAWLLPQLSAGMSERRAVVISSVLWAFWHIPYAVAGIQHIDDVPPTMTAFIIPVGIFGSGLVIGWLWFQTESVWIVAIAHGALNNWGQYAFKFMSAEGRPREAVVLGAGSLALIIVGVVLLQNQPPRHHGRF